MWIQSRTFLLFAIAFSILGVAHVTAITFFLYWTYPWLDFPMHTLGGVVVALGFLTLFSSYARGTFQKGLLITVSVALAAGLLWEFFELVSGVVMFTDMGYMWDTGHDLVTDIVGGSLGYLCARASMRV